MLLEIERGGFRERSERRHSVAELRALPTELSVANSIVQPYPLIIRRSQRRTVADVVQPQAIPSPIPLNQARGLGGHLKSGQLGSPENRPVVDRHRGQ